MPDERTAVTVAALSVAAALGIMTAVGVLSLRPPRHERSPRRSRSPNRSRSRSPSRARDVVDVRRGNGRRARPPSLGEHPSDVEALKSALRTTSQSKNFVSRVSTDGVPTMEDIARRNAETASSEWKSMTPRDVLNLLQEVRRRAAVDDGGE